MPISAAELRRRYRPEEEATILRRTPGAGRHAMRRPCCRLRFFAYTPGRQALSVIHEFLDAAMLIALNEMPVLRIFGIWLADKIAIAAA